MHAAASLSSAAFLGTTPPHQTYTYLRPLPPTHHHHSSGRPRAIDSRMMSSRQVIGSGTIAPAPSDAVDFGYAGPMHSSTYASFEPAPLLQHHQLYDSSFDFPAANAFQFQDPFTLFSSGSPLANQQFAPQITMPPMVPSSLLQAPTAMTALPGVPSAADAYNHPYMLGGAGSSGFLKREDGGPFFADAGCGGGGGRIGLNLGRRTYFSPSDVLAVDRLLMRSRLGGMGVLGLGLGAAHAHHPPPRCQAEGCKADLSAAKHYHRRHKVCEYHAKAATVAASGKHQRFCQQCSRFHVLAEFDEAKRSCRKRLTEHNRRRRKPAGTQGKDTPSSMSSKKADDASSYDDDHRTNKSSTTVVAVSPTASGFSCLQQQQQQQQHDLDNGGQSSNTATAPTTLSLAAPPLHDRDSYGAGLDTMLLHQQGRDEEQGFMMTSLGPSHQQQQRDSGNILSCSTTSASDQRRHHNDGDSCCNGNSMQHFFEVDFM